MTDEPTMISTEEDVVALRSLLDGCEAVVDEIKRVREAVTVQDRSAKIAALTKEFNRRVDELRTYSKLIGLPVTEEGEA